MNMSEEMQTPEYWELVQALGGGNLARGREMAKMVREGFASVSVTVHNRFTNAVTADFSVAACNVQQFKLYVKVRDQTLRERIQALDLSAASLTEETQIAHKFVQLRCCSNQEQTLKELPKEYFFRDLTELAVSLLRLTSGQGQPEQGPLRSRGNLFVCKDDTGVILAMVDWTSLGWCVRFKELRPDGSFEKLRIISPPLGGNQKPEKGF